MKPIPAFTHALVHPATLPPRTPEEEARAMAEAKAANAATPWRNTAKPSQRFLDFCRAHGIKDATDFASREKRKVEILDAGLVQLWDARGR